MTKLAYTRIGSGKPLVFLHGLGGSNRVVKVALAPYLADQFELICIDLPGHGESPTIDIPDVPTLIPTLATMVIETLDELNIQEFALCGHSFGGTVAIDAAFLYKDRVRALALNDAPYWGEEFSNAHRLPFFSMRWLSRTVHHPSLNWWFVHQFPELLKATKKIIRLGFRSILSRRVISQEPELFSALDADGVTKELQELRRTVAENTDKASWSACVAALFQHDGRHAIMHIECPTFLIGGRNTSPNAVRTSFRIGDLLQKGKVFCIPPVVTIEGAGHDLPYTHPKEFMQHVQRFLAQYYK